MKTTTSTRIQGRASRTALTALGVAALVLLALVHAASAHAVGSNELRLDDSAGSQRFAAVGGARTETIGAVKTANTSGNDIAVEDIVIAHEGFEPTSAAHATGAVFQQGRVLLDADLNPAPASSTTSDGFRTVEGLKFE